MSSIRGTVRYIIFTGTRSPVLYHELSFSAAKVSYKGTEGSFGFYYVDNQVRGLQCFSPNIELTTHDHGQPPLDGGWDIWGIEKEIASFTWDKTADGDHVAATGSNQ